jgi:hypothetical protein
VTPIRWSSAPRATLRETPQQAPTIRVTIGRIDVRAVTAPAEPARETVRPQPRLSLDDYLKQRNRGGR